MSEVSTATAAPGEQTYPLSQKLNINYSAIEDRLVVRAERMAAPPVTLLLTRRMTILILQQTLKRLPELSALDKTPAVYWQEVMTMAHQRAMTAKVHSDKEAGTTASETSPATVRETEAAKAVVVPEIFLGTEITVQLKEKRLTLGFRGLLMPDAMTVPSKQIPVLAVPLAVDNVHQLIELLIVKAQEAQWHLPVDLPWSNAPATAAAAAGGMAMPH